MWKGLGKILDDAMSRGGKFLSVRLCSVPALEELASSYLCLDSQCPPHTFPGAQKRMAVASWTSAGKRACRSASIALAQA